MPCTPGGLGAPQTLGCNQLGQSTSCRRFTERSPMSSSNGSPDESGEGMVLVRVADEVNQALTGHPGCRYESPPQGREQAPALMEVLAGYAAGSLDGSSPAWASEQAQRPGHAVRHVETRSVICEPRSAMRTSRHGAAGRSYWLVAVRGARAAPAM
jgi:hypothetical protein